MYVYIYLCMNVCKYACIYVFYMHECVYYVCMQSCVDTSEGYTYGYLHIVCVCVCSYTLNMYHIEKLTGSETCADSNCWICFSGNYSITVTDVRQFYTSYKLECLVPSSYSVFCTDAVNLNKSI